MPTENTLIKALTFGLLLTGMAFGADDWREAKVTAVTYELVGVSKGTCYALEDGKDEYTACEVAKFKVFTYPEDFAAAGDAVSYRLDPKATQRFPMYIRLQSGREHGVWILRTNKRPGGK